MPLPDANPMESGSAAGPVDGLAAIMVEELVAAWGRGECAPAEVFLERHPEVWAHPEAAIRLVYEEVCLRRGDGQDVPPSELVGRFPQWQAELEVLLECDRLLESGRGAPDFPAPGELLGDFRLLAELGRGTRGRCFLAAQPSLADRPVVLKVTSDDHSEHLSLARLQHTHIVPLYSEQRFRARNLRALCMPHLGGSTLAQVFAVLGDVPTAQRTGRSLLDALERARSAAPKPPDGASPIRQFLARTTYIHAVCWIGACLADALQYAHDRGLMHMDVKPSNVLLAADGQPMLLDFHLARAPLGAGEAPPEWMGGTPDSMSPEQRAAVAAVSAGRAIPWSVDARSDLYSLGRVLYDALGGRAMPGRDAAEVRFPHTVSTGLGDILRKCLAHDPRDRYRDAAALADDLRRHMADLPLLGVANRSLSERWVKWSRRRPSALLRVKVLLAAAATASVVAATVWIAFLTPRFREAEHALLEGKVLLSRSDYPDAIRTLTRGVALIEGLPGGRRLSRELAVQLRRAHRAPDGDRLHDLVERLRFLESADPLVPASARGVERQCRAFWESRRSIVEHLGGEPDREAGHRLRSDLLDLAVIGTGLRVRLAEDEVQVASARREALRVLDEAEAEFGPSHLLYREREAQARALGLSALADQAAREASRSSPRTAWEHCAAGRSLLASGDPARAAAAFDQALSLRPQDFWSNFYQGVCSYRLRRYEDAIQTYRVCIALAPGRAECYYNRALARAALGQAGPAALDYGRAADLDPSLAPSFPDLAPAVRSAGR